LPSAVADLVRQGWSRAGLVAPDDLRAFRWTVGDGGAAGARPAAVPRGAAVPTGPGAPPVGPDAALRSAHVLGLAYEAQLDAGARSVGAHYTPLDVALGLARVVLDGELSEVWDPSCGGGALLLAAAEVMRGRGL